MYWEQRERVGIKVREGELKRDFLAECIGSNLGQEV